MFSSPFPGAFAIDIGDLSLKVVQLKNTTRDAQKPSYEITNIRSTSLPAGFIVNGELEQPEQVRKYLQHLLAGGKGHKPIQSRWVAISIPDTQGFIKLIHLEKKEEEIIEEDILYAAKRHLPFDIEEYYIDWQIMPEHSMGENTTDILIGAAPKRISDMYTYLFESLGLGVMALEIEALATARAMITASKSYENEARVILDLGATRSSLIIADHGHIQFSISLPYSGEIVTTAIAQKLHISHDEAEKKKIEDGLEFQKGDAWSVMAELTDRLALEIQKGLAFYASHFPKPNTVTHITMCGGASALKKLDAILSLKLNIVAKPGIVHKNLGLKKDPAPPLKHSYATAIGLAIRAADNPFSMSDLV